MLEAISSEMNLNFCAHTLSKGFYELESKRVLSDDKTIYGAIDYASEQIKRKSNLTMIFTETPDLSSDNEGARLFLDLVSLANENGGMIIVLSNVAVWSQLQRLGMSIKIAPPNEEEMFEIINSYINDYRSEIKIEWNELDVKEAANILSGVTQIEAENVIAALIAKKQITKKDMDDVRFAKDRLFNDISGLERIEVDSSVKDVGGLDGLRKWLDEKRELLSAEKKDILKQKGILPPRGILLVGVPGCGKSLSAKSIAANWHLPLYRLDFAAVQGMYVGQSEQQLKEALSTAESVSPCVLWIDEIEKGLAGAGTESTGVSTRMVGQFLFWLQECKKQVFVVATANDVSQLPSELLRRGRFDELFFVDLPTKEERIEIMKLYFMRYLDSSLDSSELANLADITDGFTGADLESTIRDLAYRSVANEAFNLNAQSIKEAFNNVVPLSQTSPEKIEAIREWGRNRAVPASGKPIGTESITKHNPKVRSVLI